MKKTLYLLFALLISFGAHAQLNKGDIQLGGGFGFTSFDQNDLGSKQFSLNPRAGLFLSNNTSVGLILGYESSNIDQFNTQNGITQELKTNTFQYGAYTRMHKSIAENLYLYLQPSLNFGTTTRELDGTDNGDSNFFFVNLAPGMAFFLSPKFSLDVSLGSISYSNWKRDINGTDLNSDQFSLIMNLTNVGIGLSYYIK